MHELPKLPYEYNALQPHIDETTMQIHHTKHHQGYVDKLNAALQGTEWENASVEEVLKNLSTLPQDKQTAVRNNGGGHANHTLFWESMAPNGTQMPQELKEALETTWESIDAFKEAFGEAAKARFGSGWAWLVLDNGKLAITSTPNQDSPLMDGQVPLLGLDVWEHSYYLRYQNKRPDYITAWWNVVNWEKVAERFSNSQ